MNKPTAASEAPVPRKMRTTMDLLELALENGNLHALSLALGLHAEALRTARSRGRLSPVLAGCLALELQQDPATWMAIAALEIERERAPKTKLLRHFRQE
ncbi:hypothetical protein J7E62_32685 [Variovorax paradoxus]|nr:hypothetical protein [Variovorax paradoxus]